MTEESITSEPRTANLGKASRSAPARQTIILTLESTERGQKTEDRGTTRSFLELETIPPTYAGLMLGDRPCMVVYGALFCPQLNPRSSRQKWRRQSQMPAHNGATYLYDCDVYPYQVRHNLEREHGGCTSQCDTPCMASPPPPSTASERAMVPCQAIPHTLLCRLSPGPPNGACLTLSRAVKGRSEGCHRLIPRLPNHRFCCTNKVPFKPRHVLSSPPRPIPPLAITPNPPPPCTTSKKEKRQGGKGRPRYNATNPATLSFRRSAKSTPGTPKGMSGPPPLHSPEVGSSKSLSYIPFRKSDVRLIAIFDPDVTVR